MNIIRHEDGSLTVPVERRVHPADEKHGKTEKAENGAKDHAAFETTTVTLHPGEGGYEAALAEWELQQHDGQAAVSTAGGRTEAMALVHHVADEHVPVEEAVIELAHPDESAEALRHVLVGGVHAVEDFAKEVAEHEHSEPLKPHQMTKVIGEVLAAIES